MSEMLNYQTLLKQIVPNIKKEMNYENIMQVPIIKTVVLSVGAGKFFKDKNKMNDVHKALSLIACQNACFTKAKKSVSDFEVRIGMQTGLKVTLRKDRMYHFLDRLKYIYLPRLRDFKGLDASSFNRNTFSFGIHNVFNCCDEIRDVMQKHDLAFGMNITIVFSRNDIEAQKKILAGLNFPFK